MQSCTKAIIPVAGYGTRRLPITKSIEKCMLPLGNRPVIDYIVRDCVSAGITDIYFVVSGAADQLRNYYQRDMELEAYLRKTGKEDKIAGILPPENVTFHYVEQDLQDGRYGTTIPVWLCRDYIDDGEHFLVMMGDDVTFAPDSVSDIERLVNIGKPAILGVPINDGPLSSYGVIASRDGVFTHIVEKPQAGQEPSRMINVSKYVLPGVFMEYADRSVRHGANTSGEYYITDPINEMVADGTELHVLAAEGTFLDTGTMESWIQANTWLYQQSMS